MGLGSSRDRECLKQQVEDFLERLQRAIIGCGQARNTFATLADLWSSSREEAIAVLSNVADEIDHHHLNVNIANLTGCSSSIAGGTAAMASLLMAPFSGGVSVALAAGGIIGTVAGTATTLGANITEVLLTKELMEKVKNVLNIDAMYTKALRESFRELVIHENDLFATLTELQNQTLMEDTKKLLNVGPHRREMENKVKHLTNGRVSLDSMTELLSHVFSEDQLFIAQLRKTSCDLMAEAPSLSTAVSSSSEFFQALKELSTFGPEAAKGISEAALQTTASTSAKSASLAAQLVTLGFGAVFVALDLHHLIKTSRNFDEGSKTELSQKIRNCICNLRMERQQVANLTDFYKKTSNFCTH